MIYSKERIKFSKQQDQVGENGRDRNFPVERMGRPILSTGEKLTGGNTGLLHRAWLSYVVYWIFSKHPGDTLITEVTVIYNFTNNKARIRNYCSKCPIRHFSVTPYITICPSTETYFGHFLRGAMSAVTGIYLYRLQLNIIFFVLRSFFTLTNSAYHDEMLHAGISAVCKCKTYVPKIYILQLKCSRISFLKLFLVPCMYAFAGCNLRVGKFDVFCVQYDYFLASVFHQAQFNGQWKCISLSQFFKPI